MRRRQLQDLYPLADLLFLDPEAMDEAVIGVCERFGQEPIVAYDRDAVIRILAIELGGELENAQEWFDYNTLSWGGDNTPCFVSDGMHRSEKILIT